MKYLEEYKSLIRKGVVRLLEIKDSDIRLSNLHQCRYAIDNAIHIGGAFSATIPMVSLFYGGIIDLDVENPTDVGQDMFVLSKGHAVATLASIYADIGYFDHSVLENSRSISSILNGHPGPVLPGVHLATGPMGQGVGVAQGLAIAGQKSPEFDVYAITGDGELQEGPVWEAVMYAGFKRLENLCVLVDNNGGQLDNTGSLHFPYHNLGGVFESFGWRVVEVDATRYHTVYDALLEFKLGDRDGRPTAIICKSTKGYGGFSDFMNKHKTSIPEELLDQEAGLQQKQRAAREMEFCRFYNSVKSDDALSGISAVLLDMADRMGLEIRFDKSSDGKGKGNNGDSVSLSKSSTEDPDAFEVVIKTGQVRTTKAPIRNKRITYTEDSLPKLESGKSYAAHHIIESAMKVFAKDKRIISVDSDLASTSGLQAGVGFVDKERALNVGVAEANMMLIGEAFGVLGSNVWISTFCPFYDWKILRRIAVGHQERMEVIEQENGWLSEGHGIDLTMVATAADLDTQSNGATHMGNDDALIMDQAAHIKIINVCCPQQLLSVMKWIMEGNRGLIYMRILRAPSAVIYSDDFIFEFGKAWTVRDSGDDARAVIVSSGRGVHEALEAAESLSKKKLPVSVVDMPSVDKNTILELYKTDKKIFILDQNNGYLWRQFKDILFENGAQFDARRLIPLNPTVGHGLHYIHSGTYAELSAHYGLDASSISDKILEVCGS